MQADQINGSTLLEIWDFGLALASRRGLPVLKRTKRCVFLLGFFAFLIFALGATPMWAGSQMIRAELRKQEMQYLKSR